jgi:hypothetical protein
LTTPKKALQFSTIVVGQSSYWWWRTHEEKTSPTPIFSRNYTHNYGWNVNEVWMKCGWRVESSCCHVNFGTQCIHLSISSRWGEHW